MNTVIDRPSTPPTNPLVNILGKDLMTGSLGSYALLEDSRQLDSTISSARKLQKGKTRERNDARWETLKDEIYRIYMTEDTPLTITMLMIEQLHGFKRSPRKWKEKLREWNFDKNLTKREMKIVVAKAEKRAAEDGKDTIFFHNGNPIPPEKVQNWQRKIAMTACSPANPYTRTPATIAYFTPRYPVALPTLPHPPENINFRIQSAAAAQLPMPQIDMSEEASFPTFGGFFIYGASTSMLDVYIQPGLPRTLNDSPNRLLALQYQQLEYRENQISFLPTTSCKFAPKFIRLLFEAVINLDSLQELQDIINSVMHYKQDCVTWSRSLCEMLGPAMVKIGDSQRATIWAECMSKAVNNNPSQWRSTAPSHFLGLWFHQEKLISEESIPYLEEAFLYDLDHATVGINLPSYFSVSASDLLEQSYHRLGPPNEWWKISDRLCKSDQAPFADRLWERIEETPSFYSHSPTILEDKLLYLRPLLDSFLTYILKPKETRRLQLFYARYHADSPRLGLFLCEYYLLAALRPITPNELTKHCRLCFENLKILAECVSEFISLDFEITKSALGVLINEIDQLFSNKNIHPYLGRSVLFPFRFPQGLILNEERDSCTGVVLEYITKRRTNSIEELHSWQPDVFQAPEDYLPHTEDDCNGELLSI